MKRPLALALTFSSLATPVFTVTDHPGSARVHPHPGTPSVKIDSAGWWRHSTRYHFPFTATLDYDQRAHTVGLTCRGAGPAIFNVEAVHESHYALVECEHSAWLDNPFGDPFGPGRHVILGPGAGRSFEGWRLPQERVGRHELLVVSAVVNDDGGTSASTLGLSR